jgi:hypothetical protein
LFHALDQILEEVGAEEMECLLRIRVLVYQILEEVGAEEMECLLRKN